VRGALFVAHQYVVDIAVLQRVIGGQNRAPRIAEYRCNTLLFQTFPKNLRASFLNKIVRPVLPELSTLTEAGWTPFKHSAGMQVHPASNEEFAGKPHPRALPKVCPDIIQEN